MKSITKKALSAFLLLLMMAAGYGAVISLCNQYLRHHQLMNLPARSALGVALFVGFYLIYRWFSNRISKIAKEDNAA